MRNLVTRLDEARVVAQLHGAYKNARVTGRPQNRSNTPLWFTTAKRSYSSSVPARPPSSLMDWCVDSEMNDDMSSTSGKLPGRKHRGSIFSLPKPYKGLDLLGRALVLKALDVEAEARWQHLEGHLWRIERKHGSLSRDASPAWSTSVAIHTARSAAPIPAAPSACSETHGMTWLQHPTLVYASRQSARLEVAASSCEVG